MGRAEPVSERCWKSRGGGSVKIKASEKTKPFRLLTPCGPLPSSPCCQAAVHCSGQRTTKAAQDTKPGPWRCGGYFNSRSMEGLSIWYLRSRSVYRSTGSARTDFFYLLDQAASDGSPAIRPITASAQARKNLPTSALRFRLLRRGNSRSRQGKIPDDLQGEKIKANRKNAETRPKCWIAASRRALVERAFQLADFVVGRNVRLENKAVHQRDSSREIPEAKKPRNITIFPNPPPPPPQPAKAAQGGRWLGAGQRLPHNRGSCLASLAS